MKVAYRANRTKISTRQKQTATPFTRQKYIYDDLMGKFGEGRGEVLWLDPCLALMIQSLMSEQGVQIGKKKAK